MKPTPPPRAAPPLYHNIVALDQALHANLHLDPDHGFAFARAANAIPLVLEEFAAAAIHFPIVFTTGPNPAPVAVLGFRNDENLFVTRDNSWAPGRYLPSYLRAYPFILVQPDAQAENYVVAMDAAAEALHEKKGTPLLHNGTPTPILQERIRLCNAVRVGLAETTRFAAAAQQAGLLVPQEAQLTIDPNQTARLDGFQIIDPAKTPSPPRPRHHRLAPRRMARRRPSHPPLHSPMVPPRRPGQIPPQPHQTPAPILIGPLHTPACTS